jgi:hypothetical protein
MKKLNDNTYLTQEERIVLIQDFGVLDNRTAITPDCINEEDT